MIKWFKASDTLPKENEFVWVYGTIYSGDLPGYEKAFWRKSGNNIKWYQEREDADRDDLWLCWHDSVEVWRPIMSDEEDVSQPREEFVADVYEIPAEPEKIIGEAYEVKR